MTVDFHNARNEIKRKLQIGRTYIEKPNCSYIVP